MTRFFACIALVRRTTALGALLIVAIGAAGGLGVTESRWQEKKQKHGAFVSGRILDGESLKGIPNCIVSLAASRSTQRGRRVVSDENGAFMFSEIDPGSYVLSMVSSGWSSSRPLKLVREQPRELVLTDDQVLTDLQIKVFALGSIEGTVVDAFGDALSGVDVRAWQRTVENGRDLFRLVSTARSDDRGIYRLGRLESAEYLICLASKQVNLPKSIVEALIDGDRVATSAVATATRVEGQPRGFSLAGWQARGEVLTRSQLGTPPSSLTLSSSNPTVYQTVFYQGATTSDAATLVHLRPGNNIEGVDLSVTEQKAAPVSGRVSRDGEAVPYAVVKLIRSNASGSVDVEGDVAITVTDAVGRFAFGGVAAGSYYLTAEATATASAGSWANEFIFIGAEGSKTLELRMRLGTIVRGHALLLGQPSTRLSEVRLSIERVDGLFSAGPYAWDEIRLGAQGAFFVPPIPPGRYRLRLQESVDANAVSSNGLFLGEDVLVDVGDVPPVDVTVNVGDQPSIVTGRVSVVNKSCESECFVMLFPVDGPDAGGLPTGLQVAHTTSEGRYRIGNLPSGTFKVVAIDRLPRLTSALLEKATIGASLITLGVGELKTLDLRAASVR